MRNIICPVRLNIIANLAVYFSERYPKISFPVIPNVANMLIYIGAIFISILSETKWSPI